VRARIVRGPGCWLLVATLVVALPVAGIVAARRADDRPTLESELARVVALVDATVAAVAGGREVALSPGVADPALAARVDRVAPLRGPPSPPGYDHCDAWRDWLLPGWQAVYGKTIRLRGTGDAERLMLAVERFWTARGHDPTAIERWVDPGTGQPHLTLDQEHATYRLAPGPERGEVELLGGTDCLPLR
jgi:hypothetical protein